MPLIARGNVGSFCRSKTVRWLIRPVTSLYLSQKCVANLHCKYTLMQGHLFQNRDFTLTVTPVMWTKQYHYSELSCLQASTFISLLQSVLGGTCIWDQLPLFMTGVNVCSVQLTLDRHIAYSARINQLHTNNTQKLKIKVWNTWREMSGNKKTRTKE